MELKTEKSIKEKAGYLKRPIKLTDLQQDWRWQRRRHNLPKNEKGKSTRDDVDIKRIIEEY